MAFRNLDLGIEFRDGEYLAIIFERDLHYGETVRCVLDIMGKESLLDLRKWLRKYWGDADNWFIGDEEVTFTQAINHAMENVKEK